jgi:DNA replication licensing factor MCM6
MDIKDQVAIHEAMEQQTISIAKAGIRATLNARASILAAANPIGGRYNPRKTLRANLGISPAIMSRFDLFFVIQDECNDDMDRNIAEHIISVHQKKQRDRRRDLYTPEDINLYLKYARTIKPELTPDAQVLLVESYRKLRQNDKVGSNSYRITVRQLESLVRLSEGLARLYSESHVETYHVEEAVRLLRTSITKVDKDPINLEGDRSTNDEKFVSERKKRAKNQLQSTRTLIENMQRKGDHLELALSKAKRSLQESEIQLASIEQQIARAYEIMEASQDENSNINLTESAEQIHDLEKSREDIKTQVSHYSALVQTLTRDLDKENRTLDNIIDEYGEEAGLIRNEDSNKRPSKKRKIEDGERRKSGKQKTMSLEEYRTISFKLLRYIRSMEDASREVTRQQVIDWYVDNEQLTSASEARELVNLLKKIIERLIERDHFLITMPPSDLQAGEEVDEMQYALFVPENINLDDYM